jgi:hypothetical protein
MVMEMGFLLRVRFMPEIISHLISGVHPMDALVEPLALEVDALRWMI